jgi:integrase
MRGAVGVYKSISGRYEIAYRDSAGKLRFQVFDGSFEDAKNARADLIARMAKGERVVAARQSFAELAEVWFAGKAPRVRPRTRAYYRDSLDLVLLPRFGHLRVQAVDADAIAKLIRELEKEGLHAIDRKRPIRPLSHSSVVNYLKPARATLALAVRRGVVQANPFAVLTADERPQRGELERAHEWTDDDVAALLQAATELAGRPIAKHDYTPLLGLVARLGLRLGEALGLRWEDFDKDNGVLHVRRQWLATREYGPTKTPAGVRRIALPADLRDELIALRLRSRHSGDGEPVFSSRTGSPLGHRNVSRRGFEAARDEASLPEELTFHDLRHAAASRLIAGGLDVVTVAGVLGHDDATTTLRLYAHMFDRRKTDDAVRAALALGRSG